MILSVTLLTPFMLRRSNIKFSDCLAAFLKQRSNVSRRFLVGHFNSQIFPLIRKSGFLLCGVFDGIITSILKPLEARKSAAVFSAGLSFTLLSIKLLFILVLQRE